MKASPKLIAADLAVFLLLIASTPGALALPPLPSSFYGTAKIDGADVPAGTLVSAWINGVRYAFTTVVEYGEDTVYSLDVAGDDPGTPGIIEGGAPGDTIVFHIGEAVADQIGTWTSGSNANLNLTATLPNHLPTITDITDQATAEDTPVGPLAFVVGDVETLANALTLSAASSNPALVPVGNILFGGSGANRSVTITPTANQTGQITVTITVSDTAGGTADDTFLLTVTSVNDAPVAVNDAYIAVENTPLTIAAPGVLYNDTDVDGNPVTAILISSVSHGALTQHANGSFVYTPTANYQGIDSFTYRANDGLVNSNIATVAITIALSNPVPMIASLNPVTVTAGSAPFLLTVTGANFVSGSTIHWDGAALATSVVSSTQLQAMINTESILIAGLISVNVVNPTPGGGLSNVLTLAVEGPSPAPQDRLIYLPFIVRDSPPVAAPPWIILFIRLSQ